MSDSGRDLGTPDKILAAALEREKAACAFYANLARHARVEMVRELVEHLKDEEHKHVRRIEDMLARLNLGRDA